MKMHTTNYRNTFIEVAEDCPVKKGEIPPLKKNGKTIANIQYEIIEGNPYKYTSDEILFKCYIIKNKLDKNIKITKEDFFSKGQPCFRASPLTKQYGWGIHNNNDSKMALYGCETTEYKNLKNDKNTKTIKALKNKNKPNAT